MSDFRIEVEADLNISNLESQLNSLKGQKVEIPVEFNTSKIKTDLSSLSKVNSTKINIDTSSLTNAVKQMNELNSQSKQLQNFNMKNLTGGLSTELSKVSADISKLDSQMASGAGTDKWKESVVSLEQEYDKLVDAQNKAMTDMDAAMNGNGSWKQAEQSVQEYNMALKTVQDQAKGLKADLTDMVSPLQQITLGNQIESWMQNNTKITKQAKQELQDYVNELKSTSNMSTSQFSKIQTGFKEIQGQQTAAGNTGLSFMSQFEKSFSRIGEFTGIYRITSQIPRLFSGMASNVLEVNEALIELRKVSDATDIELSDSFEHATESAKEYGAAISDVISSQADWARLGYSVQESEQLADVTTLLQAVGDNMTQESSTEGLISVLRGFQYDASQAQDIVDIVNEVANNEPIDTSGLFDSLERCASSLYAANNTLEESVALVTTANSVVQNPESVGKMLADIKDNYIG